ncbi:MAG TPA: hypothetical protein VFK92_00320 [Burkholderiales bacterium]|nr:hypothetical protein [Burkholderiales bacterium]
MKDLRPAFLAALLCACPAMASPAGDIAGTWECRLPGVEYHNKPPILYVADAGSDQVTIEVDGFAREIYGRSEVLADADGWFKVKPAQGQEFMIRPEGVTAKVKTASMGLRLGDAKGDYRCLRLPMTGTPVAAPAAAAGQAAPAAPAAETAPPAAAEPSPAPAPSGEPSAAPSAMPSEGAVKKDY